MNHLMSVQHSEYKVLCNSTSKPQAWLSGSMKEYALALKELRTSAQIAFKGRQQHSVFALSQISVICLKTHGVYKPSSSINQFSFRSSFTVLMLFPEKVRGFLLFLAEAGMSPQLTFKLLHLEHLLSLPVLPCKFLLAILVLAGSFFSSVNFSPKRITDTSNFQPSLWTNRYFCADTIRAQDVEKGRFRKSQNIRLIRLQEISQSTLLPKGKSSYNLTIPDKFLSKLFLKHSTFHILLRQSLPACNQPNSWSFLI